MVSEVQITIAGPCETGYDALKQDSLNTCLGVDTIALIQ